MPTARADDAAAASPAARIGAAAATTTASLSVAPPSRSQILEDERRRRAGELADLGRQIAVSKDRISNLDKEILSLADDQGRIREAMIEAADKQKAISAELSATEERTAALATREGSIKASLSKRRGVLAEVLAALERMGRKPPPALLVKPQDALGSVRSAILLGAVVPSLRHETEKLLADLDDLAKVRQAIDAEKARYAQQMEHYREEGVRLDKLFGEKERLEAQNRGERNAEADRARALAGKASSLQDLIASLDADAAKAKAAEDAARQSAAAAPGGEAAKTSRPGSPAGGGGDASQGEDLEKNSEGEVEVASIAPDASLSGTGGSGFDLASLRRDAAHLAPGAAFSTLKGRLSKPVAGRQLIGFGDADDIGRNSTGISLQARENDVVTSPADANVLYAGPFRSYGQVLILDVGDGYHLVLAGMSRIDVSAGQFVSAGEPVATMGAKRVASVAVAEFGAADPALYVEFRKDGRPVDPSPWWIVKPSGRTRNDS